MARVWLWLIVLGVGSYFVVRLLLSASSREYDVVDVLGLVLSILGIVISVAQLRQDRREGAAAPQPWPRRRRIAVAVVVSLAVAAVGIDWLIRETRDIDVTRTLTVPDHHPLRHDGTIMLGIPGSPPERSHLTLTLQLSNPDQTGNCRNTMRVELRPVLDDRNEGLVQAAPGQAVELSLAGVQKKAEVMVRMQSLNDLACQATVTVVRAILHD